jgi:hypothetical protein
MREVFCYDRSIRGNDRDLGDTMSATARIFAGAVVALAICHGPATAQVSAPTASGAPIQSRIGDAVTSRESHDAYIQARAQAAQDKGDDPSARYRIFSISWSDEVDEYQRMARYVVMLLTVVTQERKELPLARVYIRAGGRDVTLRKIGSTRREYATGNVAGIMFGRYREDAFYLVPGGALMRDGAVYADFSANRTEMGVVQLPTVVGQDRVKTFPTDDPPANIKPDADTFKAFVSRK